MPVYKSLAMPLSCGVDEKEFEKTGIQAAANVFTEAINAQAKEGWTYLNMSVIDFDITKGKKKKVKSTRSCFLLTFGRNSLPAAKE